MTYKFANNANSTLDIAASATDTVLYITSEDAAKFPTTAQGTCGEFFMVTLEDPRVGTMEICRCISRVGRKLSVERAQEDTTPYEFAIGTKVSHRVTRDTLRYFNDKVTEFYTIWQGIHATHPVKDVNGCPLAAGMLYYNSTYNHLYVFNGADWVSDADNPFALDSKLYYIVGADGAGQTRFDGTDIFGNVMALSAFSMQPITGHINGVEIVPDDGTGVGDYTVDYANNWIDLAQGVPEGTVVSFSLFTDPNTMRPAGMVSWTVRGFNINPATSQPDYFDGARTIFKIVDDDTGDPLYPRSARELLVSTDGVMQQAGTDYLVSADEITFTVAPTTTARPWAVLFGAPGQGAGGTIDHTQLINRDVINQHAISGITNLQTTLNGKASTTHPHTEGDITNLDKYTQLEVDTAIATRAPAAHAHTEGDITGLDKYTQAEVDAIAVPPGGAIRAVLTKQSAANNDVDWGYALEVITQANYDLLAPPDANTLYFILE